MAIPMRSPFKSYDRLKKSGMTEEQARGIVEAIEESAEFSFKDLSTKSDLLITKSELKADIAAVRTEMAEMKSELKAEIAEVRTEMAEMKSELKAEIAEVRTEMAEIKSELKAEIAEVKIEISEIKTDIKAIKTSIRSLQTMFMSGFLVIVVGMILSFFHH